MLKNSVFSVFVGIATFKRKVIPSFTNSCLILRMGGVESQTDIADATNRLFPTPGNSYGRFIPTLKHLTF
jgi:hypothetical protein